METAPWHVFIVTAAAMTSFPPPSLGNMSAALSAVLLDSETWEDWSCKLERGNVDPRAPVHMDEPFQKEAPQVLHFIYSEFTLLI